METPNHPEGGALISELVIHNPCGNPVRSWALPGLSLNAARNMACDILRQVQAGYIAIPWDADGLPEESIRIVGPKEALV